MNFIKSALLLLTFAAALALPTDLRAEEQTSDTLQTETPPTKEQAFRVDVVGEGPPMILIHGIFGSAEVWSQTTEHFKDRYTIHALTLAGFGGQPPINAPYREKITDQLREYIETNDLRDAVLIGHSLGGHVAMQLASEMPDRVAAMVSVDAAPCISALTFTDSTSATMMRQAETSRRMVLAADSASYGYIIDTSLSQTVSLAAEPLLRSIAEKTERVALAEAVYDTQTADMREAIAKIEAPTLFMEASGLAQNELTHQELERNFRNQLGFVKKMRMLQFRAARHFIMLDRPTEYLRALDEFLADPPVRNEPLSTPIVGAAPGAKSDDAETSTTQKVTE